MIALYYRARNRDAVEALLGRLRDEGRSVRPANAEYFDPDQLEPVDAVYHDGTEPRIPEAYEAAGVPCQPIGDYPAASGPAPDDAGYHVEKSGSWYKLIGPGGQQVGKSQRSEDDAWALVEDGD